MVFKKAWLATLVVLMMMGVGSSAVADRVIIIAGKGGQPAYTEKFNGYADKLHRTLLEKLGYQASQITVLREGRNDSTTHLRKAVANLATLPPDEQVVVIYFGHGTYDGRWAKLNLAGPDLRDLDLANLLDGLPARQQIFIHTGAASGPFIQKLSRTNRVIITATRSGDENQTTLFPEFFIDALTATGDADLDKNGEVSMLEAFDYARDRLVRFYEDAKRLRPEHPLLDDNGDGVGSETPSTTSSDGRIANRMYLKARASAPTGEISALDPLQREKVELLDAIEAFKAQKGSIPDTEYKQRLEELFIRLARLNREIKASSP